MKPVNFGNVYEDSLENAKDVKRIRFYGVDLTFKQNGKENRLLYTIKVQYDYQINLSDWVISLTKSGVYLNDKSPDGYKQEFDLEFGTNVLYPLQVVASQKGDLKWIKNDSCASFVTRYEAFKKKILKANTGIYVDNYFRSLGGQMPTKQLITERLLSDWFWALYFQPVREYHTTTPVTLLLPLGTFKEPVAYKGDLEPLKELSYYNTYQTKFKGTAVPHTLSNDYMQRKEKAMIDLLYDFDKETYLIRHITARHQVVNQDQVLREIRIKIMHLKEKDLQPEPEKPKLSTEQKIIKILSKII